MLDVSKMNKSTSNYLLPKLINCTSERVVIVMFRAVMFIS